MSSVAIHTSAPLDHPNDRKIWIGTTAIVAGLFLILQNQFWIPGGDSELYVAIARNLLNGNGYMFNGRAARIAPPGWPWVLAFLIKFVSPTFLLLKLVTLASMTAALAVFYRVLRRFASPMLSAGIILLTAIISHVYPLTFWLHSDALFTLLTALTLLVALQISEGKQEIWRIALLVALAIAAMFVRWAGLPNVLIICAALVQGRWWRGFNAPTRKQWIAVLLIIITVPATFRAIKWGLKRFEPPTVMREDTALVDPNAQVNDTDTAEGAEAAEVPVLTSTGEGHTGYATRVIGFGTWPAYLLWQPLRLATGFKLIFWLATGVGWFVIAIMCVACIDEAKKMRWLLPAAFLYMLALDLNWPQANARYLVPLTPMLLLLIVRGLQVIQAYATEKWQRITWRTIGVAGIASVVLCNATLYSIDAWVMRSDFKERYEAGLDKDLVAIAKYLTDHKVGHWQVCVNVEYRNINKRRKNPTGLRKLTMLTGKAMQQMPWRYTASEYAVPRGNEFREWLRKYKVRYYIEQTTISPWRVWHFRTPWLQEKLTGARAGESDSRWVLYRCDGRKLPIEVPVEELDQYPTRVPGF